MKTEVLLVEAEEDGVFADSRNFECRDFDREKDMNEGHRQQDRTFITRTLSIQGQLFKTIESGKRWGGVCKQVGADGGRFQV